MVKHYFHFITLNEPERVEIAEPWGSDGVGFSLKKDTDRKGTDTTFSGNGEAQFVIKKGENHQFEKMLTCFLRKGHEAIVTYEIEFNKQIQVVGEVDFKTFKTDMVNEASFTVIQSTQQAVFKRRIGTSIDMLSGKDIKGNPITSPPLYDVLLKSPPISQTSKWNTSSVDKYINLAGNYLYMAIARSQETYEIKNSLTPFSPSASNIGDAIREFIYIRADDNITNLKLKVDMDVLFDYRQQGGNAGTSASISLNWIAFDGEYPNGTVLGAGVVYTKTITGTAFQTFQLPSTVSIDLVDLPRGCTLSLYWSYTWVTATAGGATVNNRTRWNMNSVSYTITGVSSSYSTVTPMMRYIDAIKYAAKAVGGFEVYAPRFEEGGEFYNQFITTPALLRKKYTGFNITNKLIFEEHIRPELNGDFLIQPDNKIFIGIYADFFRDYLCGDYKQSVFSGYEAGNSLPTANLVDIEYKNYADTDENGQVTSGKAQYVVQTDRVEDTREISIGFIRDANLIGKYQKDIFVLSEETQTQSDDKIIIIDCIPKTTAIKFTDTSRLRHVRDAVVNNKLILTISTEEGETFNWADIGVEVTSNFNILNGANAGSYFVFDINGIDLILLRNDNTTVNNLDAYNTTYEYFIGSSVTIMNRTNEGITTSGIDYPERGINLAWSVRQVLERFYKVSIGTDTFFLDNKALKNSLYKNNGTAIINGIQENSDFTPVLPVVTPFTRSMTVLSSLSKYWDMVNKIRTERGYVRCYDPNGCPVDLFIDEATWTNRQQGRLKGKIELKGVEMYRPFLVYIIVDGGIININENITVTHLDYSIDGLGNVKFKDATGKRLLPVVQFNRIRVGDSGQATSTDELIGWLKAVLP